MSKWWYITIYKCPDCNTTWETYDHTAPWCDSGLSTCPVIEQRCEECFQVRHEHDLAEEVLEHAIEHVDEAQARYYL